MAAAGCADMSEPGTEYDLVMPFVVCASNGGPYDDAAFVAGWRAAELDRDLALRRVRGYASASGSGVSHDARDLYTVMSEPELLPQMDLIAMRHDYRVTTVEPHEDGAWLSVTLQRGEAEGDTNA